MHFRRTALSALSLVAMTAGAVTLTPTTADASVCRTSDTPVVSVPLESYETVDYVNAWIQTRHLCDGGRQTRVGFNGFAYCKGHRAVEFNPTPWRGRDIGMHRYPCQTKAFTSAWSSVWHSHSTDATFSAIVTFDEVRAGDPRESTGTARL